MKSQTSISADKLKMHLLKKGMVLHKKLGLSKILNQKLPININLLFCLLENELAAKNRYV